jgi:glutamate formiminotransferase/formiminotetrahydrofolate cyclodeaminase
MDEIIECVPNISEGKDPAIINAIAGEIKKVEGVKLLDVDSNISANRTVITFAGAPPKVTVAAFNMIKKALDLIDMRTHKGVHPRIGTVDVCPLVPLRSISMKETAEYARQLAMKVAKELGIAVYCYGYAAYSENRKNLAQIRSGQYEGLKKKMSVPEWKPDFGPARFNPKSGATAIGARNIMLAYNINLDSKSLETAKNVASYIRTVLEGVKAIGWYISEYNCAQVSTNIYDTGKSPLYVVFEEVSKKADEYGVGVTGSEIVGLVPLEALVNAGKHFSARPHKSGPNSELIDLAIDKLGLNDVKVFDPGDKIIEFLLNF